MTNIFIPHEMAQPNGKVLAEPLGCRTNGKARAGLDTYTTDKGIYGTGTYALAYYQRAHEVSCINHLLLKCVVDFSYRTHTILNLHVRF
jgi:hypothetical protein